MTDFTARLNELDKEHKFAILRSLYGSDYRKEIHRLRLPDKLYQIYEDMGLAEMGKQFLQEYNNGLQRERWDRRFLSCYSCGGSFLRSIDSCELYCKKCGRVEVLEDYAPAYTDQNIFYKPSQRQSARCYAFGYALKRISKKLEFLPVELTIDQINNTKRIFKLIEARLPRISYTFVIYKILDITTPLEAPQRAIVNCLRQQMSNNMIIKNEHLWNNAFKDLE